MGCTQPLTGARSTGCVIPFLRWPSSTGKHFVEDGRVFTSAGISAGIDMSLKVVARHLGEDIARATARHMEYPYPESDARRIQI